MPIRAAVKTNQYLKKHQLSGTEITSPVLRDLGICVVIPVHNEPDVGICLASLTNCNLPQCGVEIIAVLNGSHRDSFMEKRQNEETAGVLKKWSDQTFDCQIRVLCIEVLDMPIRHAGVGLARKIGMDESVRRFGVNDCHNGIIVSLDADCVVDCNYFTALESYFKSNTTSPGCSIHFEHALDGDRDLHLYEGIARYELGLRYYKNGLMASKLPYAHYTIGSALAVRANAYQSEGGMNRRQAGEDFYFTHKIARLGGFGALNETTVRPSNRPSNRVPFGTGNNMVRWMQGDDFLRTTYDLDAFRALADLSQIVPSWYKSVVNIDGLPASLKNFLNEVEINSIVEDIRERVASEQTFIQRFYRCFDALMAFRYIRYATKELSRRTLIEQASLELLKWCSQPIPKQKNVMSLLKHYRVLDRTDAWRNNV